MEQFEQSLDMMRNGCAPKFKVTQEQLDNLRNGFFDESSDELKVRILTKYLKKCVYRLNACIFKPI